ncbi:hypothetical protein [Roseobacter weihaiensis]|uniref:hypothetical protein n=1 Tax=Roseobacter weihaiensis TaxID=2763262 RepID=UPI001D0B864E|nr:hypothetical protein [Roseobacter sp. H9]
MTLLTSSDTNNHNDIYEGRFVHLLQAIGLKRETTERAPQAEKKTWEPMPCGGPFLTQKTIGLVRFDEAGCPELAEWMTAWGAEVFSILLSRPEEVYHLDLDAMSVIVLVDTAGADHERNSGDPLNSLSSQTAQRIRQANCEVPIVLVGESVKTTAFTATTCLLYDASLRLPTTKTGLSIALSAASTNNLSSAVNEQPGYQCEEYRKLNTRSACALEYHPPMRQEKNARAASESESWTSSWVQLSMFIAVILAAYEFLSN